MRVLLVVDSLKGGGAEAEVLGLLATLVGQHHDVAVAFFNDGRLRPRFEALTVRVHQVSRSGWRDPLALPRLIRVVRRFRPDVVHTHLAKSDAFGLAAARLSGVHARISTMQNTNPWRESWLGSISSRVSLWSAQRVVAVSPAVRAHLRRFSGVPEWKSLVISNSVDGTSSDPPDRNVRPPAPGSSRRVGIVGRLVPEKGHSLFLRAAARVHAQCPDVEFEIIGEGPLGAALERQSAALGLKACVRFTGFVDDVPQVLRRLEMLVMPSTFEGLPLALLEGMAAALPIVASRVGGIPDAITDGEHGVLVASGDEAGLVAAMLDLLHSPDKARALGAAARARVVREFDRRAAHERVLRLYSALLSGDEDS